MPRFFPFPLASTRASTRFSSTACLSLGMWLAAPAFLAISPARADEFSALPANDPIATQLALLSPPVLPAAGAARPSLTRYEAALQTARVILDVQNREAGTVSRTQWRAVGALCVSLRKELRQLGVDVDAARALADKNLKATDVLGASKTGVVLPRTALSNSRTGNSKASNFKTGDVKAGDAKAGGSRNTERSAAFLSPSLLSNPTRDLKGEPSEASEALELQLLPRVRASTDLQRVLARGANPLDSDARFAPRGAEPVAPADTLASQTALSYDLSHYLTLRAANSRLDWNGAAFGAAQNPLLGAPLFAGARGASGTGGGVDLNVGGGLKFSTEVERLRADTGALASRIGGGASLSAFQDRLSLRMSLSRLTPGARGALPATAAQASASLDVTPRLSLNLRYQGLFAPTPSTSASRVAGGVSLSF